MRAELILIITIMALTSFFSALGMPNARGTMEEPRDTLIGGLGERNIAIFRNNAQISPDSAQTGNATRAQILMAHPRTLSCYWSADLRPLSDNEFEQVNYDGFDEYGNRYRGQAFAIQQFARPLNEGGTRTELYVGVEAGSTNRSQVWRSDYPPKPGSWVQVAEDWFDPSETGNAHIDSSAVFKDWLFMGVCNGGGCQVWYTDGTEEEGNSPYLKWQKAVDCGFGSGHYEGDNLVYDNCNAYCMTVFDKHLYIGTFNDYSGCEVWRTDGSLNEGGPEMNWETVNYGGFKSSGSGAANICVMDMVVYKDSLYAGTHNRCWGSGYTTETQWSAGRIFRFAPNQNDSRNWDLVWDGVVNPGGDPPKYALAARCFTEFQNKLYVGLFHDSGHDIFNSDGGSWTGVSNIDGENVSDVIDLINFCDTNEDPPTNHMYATAGQGTSQLVWRTADGMNWEERSEVGFGDENNESLFCFGTFGKAHEFNALYVGTWNNTDEDGTGTEIWQTPKPDSDCTYITLTSFDAAAQKDGSIMLRWETGTELGSAGFHLYRSESPDFRSFERITQKMIPARGSAAEGAVYRALDKSVEPGTLYYYFLVEIDANGKMSTFGPVQARAKVPIPETFEMYSAIIQMDTNGV